MIGHNGRSLCHHERKLRVEDRLAFESAVLPDGGFARAKTILAAYEERQVAFELALISREKTNQAPEMIIMSMAQYESINLCGIELENGDVVVDRFRHVAKINEDIAHLAPALRLRVHGKSPLPDEIVTRWGIWTQITSRPPLNC